MLFYQLLYFICAADQHIAQHGWQWQNNGKTQVQGRPFSGHISGVAGAYAVSEDNIRMCLLATIKSCFLSEVSKELIPINCGQTVVVDVLGPSRDV